MPLTSHMAITITIELSPVGYVYLSFVIFMEDLMTKCTIMIMFPKCRMVVWSNCGMILRPLHE
jgi:hypothetical protein